VLNLRDTGGHLTRSGGRMRRGVLWRGDAPFDLDCEARRRLSSLKLRMIVDLRRPRERDRWPYDPRAIAPQTVEVPLIGDVSTGPSLDGGFGPFNTWVLDARGEAVAGVVSALARPGALPALVHCTAGKDRTGILIALIQAWLGVPDGVIADEYSRSAELLRADSAEAIEKQRRALGVDVRKRPDLLEARPEWIIEALDSVRREYETLDDYLLEHGARRRDLDRLRAALLAQPGAPL
jgi:protein-tyrosine phosphatase